MHSLLIMQHLTLDEGVALFELNRKKKRILAFLTTAGNPEDTKNLGRALIIDGNASYPNSS